MILFIITWILSGIGFMFLTSYLIMKIFTKNDIFKCFIFGFIGGYIVAIFCFISILEMIIDDEI